VCRPENLVKEELEEMAGLNIGFSTHDEYIK
jgi:hypothetical protein